MPGPQTKNRELWDRLVGGDDPHQLIHEGYPRTTVIRLASQTETGEYTQSDQGAGSSPHPGSGAKRRPPSQPVVIDTGDTVIRLTEEQIVLHGAMFMLYDHCRLRYPEYTASKAEWIMDVIRCWAEDHAEMLQLNPMTWAYLPQLDEPDGHPEEEEEDD